MNDKTNKRIFITGPGGVGKSTYAKNLAKQKNIKYYQLDHIRYPNGVKLSNDKFRNKLRKIVSSDSWIIEGTLKNTQDIIFPRCTQIIVLKASRLVCTFRTIKRTIKRILNIESSTVFNDLDKLFSKDFIVFWVWRNYPRYIMQIKKALQNTPHNAQVIEIKI